MLEAGLLVPGTSEPSACLAVTEKVCWTLDRLTI